MYHSALGSRVIKKIKQGVARERRDLEAVGGRGSNGEI